MKSIIQTISEYNQRIQLTYNALYFFITIFLMLPRVEDRNCRLSEVDKKHATTFVANRNLFHDTQTQQDK